MDQSHRINRPALARTFSRLLSVSLLLLLSAATAHAQSVALAWDANPESDISGYVVYYGTASGVYTSNISAGNVTTRTVTGLTVGTRYYFALKATNTSGLQSPYSVEINTVVQNTTPPGTPASPSPANNATTVGAASTLTWSATGATSYTVRFGTANPPPQVATNVTSPSYKPSSNMTANTKYYWQIVATNAGGSTTGPVWSLTTASASPGAPTSPSPSNGATNVSTGVTLTWTAQTATSYSVRLGTANPPPQVSSSVSTASYKPSSLVAGTQYFWQIVANSSSGNTTGPVWSFTTAGSAPPATMNLGATSLRFAATKASAGGGLVSSTPEQDVSVDLGSSASAWSASANKPWIKLTTATGAGTGIFGVSIEDPTNSLGSSSSATGTITVTAGSLSKTVGVTLTVQFTSVGAPPFGSFDTPVNGASGLTGAIAVTGWALDDVGVNKVQLWRNCVESIDRPLGVCSPAFPGSPADYVYIGDGAFLAGARPDVESLNATAPQAYRAGWGYLMSTNALPHIPTGRPTGGQGTFTLFAYAVDMEGQFTGLGSKTIGLDNDHATLPFGTIDTPAQGGMVTTTVFANFGWAMTQNPKCIDVTKTTSYKVYIDGISRTLTPGVNWFAGLNRSDLAAAYPGLCNSNNALAAYYIDTVALGLTNGLHTIGWDAIDNQGNAAGIGSRFFQVLIGASSLTSSLTAEGGDAPAVLDDAPAVLDDAPAVLGDASQLASLVPASTSVRVQVGMDTAPFDTVTPDAIGQYRVQFPAGSRILLDLGGAVDGGYQIVGNDVRELPGGSTFKPASGTFAWQPPVPFLGTFHLVFTREGSRLDVMATIADPTAPSTVAVQIDTPTQDSTVRGSFVVAGWALDTQATSGTGIDTLHVWAYRRDGVAQPVFLGAAAVGGLRPDVAAIFGEQFMASGYTLTTPALTPGVYDILVYPWSRRAGGFKEAQVVRVTVR